MISYVAILEPLAVAMPVLLLFSMATAAASAASVEEKKLPNFVMVLTDDLGWNTAWHNSDLKTPTLNAMVKESIEMSRHYVYRYCAPTRGAFLTGRYPMRLSATRANLIPWSLVDGINTSYTYLPKHLKQKGYRTHHVGKWHNGFYEYAMTPPGRGFDTSLGFLVGGEDHWTSGVGSVGSCRNVVDLSYGWAHNRTVAPATGLNGTYTGHLFSARAEQVVREHPLAAPLFLYAALHNTHAPIESPPEYKALYSFPTAKQNLYYGQVSFVDRTVANLTSALRETGLWENTVFIWTTDNGSPVNSAGSNDPLRGGKGSMWDGGYRVPGFIGGGLIPAAKRGTKLSGVIHISDWWPTFSALAGLPTSDTSGPTPTDGVDQSQYILGGGGGGGGGGGKVLQHDVTAATGAGALARSPRVETVLDHLMHCVSGPGFDPEQCVRGQTPDFPAGHYPNYTAGALLVAEGGGSLGGGNGSGDDKLYKLLVGPAAQASWYGHWPTNGSKRLDYNAAVACWPEPCLFELEADPSEHVDLSKSEPAVFSRLLARFKDLEESYHPPKTNPPPDADGLCAAIKAHGGFMHPWR